MFLPQNDDEFHSLNHITEFLFSEFSRIFGKKVMENEDCPLFNQTQGSCPIILNTKPTTILLSCEGLSYWSQVIFQLSHEMCHFSIRQKKTEANRYFTVSWFEELVCESFSLYCLHFSAAHWSDCALSRVDPLYSASIEQYLQNELCQQGNNRFSNITTIHDISVYEKAKEAENDRTTQRNERNLLYYEIKKHPEQCCALCDYQNYLVAPDNISIDFEKWIFDTNNDVVRFISKLVNF